MKKLLSLGAVTLCLGGWLLWELHKRRAAAAEYTLPSPHQTAAETLFLTNIHETAVSGWTLWDNHSTLRTYRDGTARTGWTVVFNDEATHRETPIHFPAAVSELLANTRNFLSLAYVSQDTDDSSALRAASRQSLTRLMASTFPAAATGIYALNVHRTASVEQQAAAGNKTTLVFIAGEAAPPLQKLYFQGTAYWVRDWYVAALQREPETLYPQTFLQLSAHTLRQVTKTTRKSQHPHTAAAIKIIWTAPYTWALNPAPPVQSRAAANNLNANVTQFIEELLFLKAERALLRLSHTERNAIKETAHTVIDFSIVSAADTNTATQQNFTLYAHKDAVYTEVAETPPLYLLPSKKAFTLFYYEYADFLR